jgi:hypothetical protein
VSSPTESYRGIRLDAVGTAWTILAARRAGFVPSVKAVAKRTRVPAPIVFRALRGVSREVPLTREQAARSISPVMILREVARGMPVSRDELLRAVDVAERVQTASRGMCFTPRLIAAASLKFVKGSARGGYRVWYTEAKIASEFSVAEQSLRDLVHWLRRNEF